LVWTANISHAVVILNPAGRPRDIGIDQQTGAITGVAWMLDLEITELLVSGDCDDQIAG